MFLSKMLDLPVIDIRSGKTISKTVGWLLMSDRPQLLCLLAKPKAWYENAAFLPFGAITGIGPRAVMISSSEHISPLHLHDDVPMDIHDCPTGMGAAVYTPSGNFLGETADIKIDDRGRIKSLLLNSGQSVSSARILTSGKSFIVSEASSPAIPLGVDENIKIASSISNEITIRKIQP
jgi:uncharacterized protein YrrD